MSFVKYSSAPLSNSHSHAGVSNIYFTVLFTHSFLFLPVITPDTRYIGQPHCDE